MNSNFSNQISELNSRVTELNDNFSQPRNKKWNIKSVLSTLVMIVTIEAVPLALWGIQVIRS